MQQDIAAVLFEHDMFKAKGTGLLHTPSGTTPLFSTQGKIGADRIPQTLSRYAKLTT